ncbi:MAG: hypothetical protein A2945_03580 [Candidatus Liptonbacteria bacterium RIFCSPLOWO2_01_FULL_52_25]|uniref:Uncharacterized protein n=1 Tax=Candidatus Liptonbacteria bacterium RIFCSPLOWO2_01_FULL_52_25 TaxID=1798650 RepID=A0A1G2CG77_9BACT|nr:MAG: hypothetical protein A2945_03580 [Candidatus Liptonbacteria bacterium RIFCSPLOWO2_01_FULL_52_25]
MKSKWASFERKEYVIEDLGRPAIFLIPIKKLGITMGDFTVRKNLHEFLVRNFSAYTTSTIPGFGFWRNHQKLVITDQCCEYEVSFRGKNKIPDLLKKLAEIARVTGEACIYVKAGQYSALVYPKKPSR